MKRLNRLTDGSAKYIPKLQADKDTQGYTEGEVSELAVVCNRQAGNPNKQMSSRSNVGRHSCLAENLYYLTGSRWSGLVDTGRSTEG